ncbi:arginine--tRNA ligase [Vampirovibrio chlorellavorus]|uniref:arginine--tRNA ligase n=1 Tax=Vampirovibrio chlorellavorus TaxID=758823 RepID=UPI0026ED4CCC|nr:arginine--tRNA ligase [Vampirovibrio chlorellavorus]
MIKQKLLNHLSSALQQAAPQLNGLMVDDAMTAAFRLERPRNPEHGDYAVNVSFLARHTKMAPPKIAEVLQGVLSDERMTVTVVGGYLNFQLSTAFLAEALVGIIHSPAPGRNQELAGERVLLEYVSANPTGPLHIGHGRWAALGDAIIRLMRHCGAEVTAEFYINDAGVQMGNITTSVYWRCVELLKAEGLLSVPVELPETLPYPGEYVLDVARAYLADSQRQGQLLSAISASPGEPEAEARQGIQDFSREFLLSDQRALLDRMRVPFESWISEKAYLYDRGVIPETLTALTAKGFTYEAEDALWFKSTEFGDEKDRVLRKSDGSFTYLMPDIAYHHDKFSRQDARGQVRYNRIMNIWGADHHGYIPRMRGAIQALGHSPEQFEVLLGQLVNLIVDGERTRMGKRRKMLTLQDVVDEVGVDATRFWMVSKSADTSLDFDVDLAASATSENPVFYVQYAHARCCSILRNAVEAPVNVDSGAVAQPFVTEKDLRAFEHALNVQTLAPLFDSLPDPKEQQVLKTLLLLLDGFEDVVRDAARFRSPHFVTQYAQDVSAQFHSFYGVCRILTPEPSLTQARLMLIRAIQKTLAQALDLLGVSAPERM